MILVTQRVVETTVDLVLKGSTVLDGRSRPVLQSGFLIVLPDKLPTDECVTAMFVETTRVPLPVVPENPGLKHVFNGVGISEEFDILLYRVSNACKNMLAHDFGTRFVAFSFSLAQLLITALAKIITLIHQLFLSGNAQDERRDNRLIHDMTEQRILKAIGIDIDQIDNARPNMAFGTKDIMRGQCLLSCMHCIGIEPDALAHRLRVFR